MIPLPAGVRVWLATGYTDMRKVIPPATVTTKPVSPGGERHKSQKHRAGKAGSLRLNLW